MATSQQPIDDTTDRTADDPQAAFIARVAAKYEAEDAKALAAEDGLEDEPEEEVEEQGGDDAGDDDTEEDPEAGTSSDDSDGSEDESEAGSKDGDEEEHPAGEEPEDSTTGDEVEEPEETTEDGTEEEEEPTTEATKVALESRGANLTLDDVPKEYRGIVEQKLRGVDAAFTRIMQDATAFRTERAQFVAEQRFRAENPELALTEAIQQALEKDPNIFDKINTRFEKLEDGDQAAAFKIVLRDKRQEIVRAITAEQTAVQVQLERVEHVVSTARELAGKAGLPWSRAERAVEVALLRKPETARDLTDDELQGVIAAEAKVHQAETRTTRRDASRDLVKTRTATRKATPPSAGRRPASSASPRPAASKTPAIDHNNEESRQAAMLRTARRVLPGARD